MTAVSRRSFLLSADTAFVPGTWRGDIVLTAVRTAAVCDNGATLVVKNSSLGLSAAELRALRPRNTVVNSRRFGFMWHGTSTPAITGGTVVNSPHATFLNKGQQLGVTVDGSKGARRRRTPRSTRPWRTRPTVAGPSYLTALSLDATSAVSGPRGGAVTMTVNRTPTAITPGASYAGAIVVTPA